MEKRYGCSIVLIPTVQEFHRELDTPHHITLLKISDEPLNAIQHDRVLHAVENFASNYDGDGYLKTEEFTRFGHGDKIVLTFVHGPYAEANLIRESLIHSMPSELRRVIEKATFFTDYVPHMTMSHNLDDSLIHMSASLGDIDGKLYFNAIEVWNDGERYTYTLEDKFPNDEIMHYGTPRHSGRYPWGSGDDPYQQSSTFLSEVDKLHKGGIKEKEIAANFNMSIRELRSRKAIAKEQVYNYRKNRALEMKDRGMSNVAIGEKLGIGESSVRNILKGQLDVRSEQLQNTANILETHLKEGKYVDISKGSETYLNISEEKLQTAAQVVVDRSEGQYVMTTKSYPTSGTNYSKMKLIVPSDVPSKEVYANPEKIQVPALRTDDNGLNWHKTNTPPDSISSRKLAVRYAEQGGTERDGLIEIRPGAKGLDLGKNQYAQVRIAVDDTHYLKGMAVYNDNLPPGVDVRFNTNKSNSGNKKDALKKMYVDSEGNHTESPWGAVVKIGGRRGALNIIQEEGDWDQWSSDFSSQFLSKQSPSLIKKQLGLSKKDADEEYDNIMKIKNPVLRKHLLEDYADNSDKRAEELKARATSGTKQHVLIPVPEMRDNEVYAPRFNNGDKVVLVRHPHGGTFEIPELVVNNTRRAAKKVVGNALDGIGINANVAERLSGADFDGDTVLVIPNDVPGKKIKATKPLAALKNFDPRSQYKEKPGMQVMTKSQINGEMGKISNLITDMTIKGAEPSEITRAVRHSMVVIDAHKHRLDYKQSAMDNNIASLKAKYQGGANKGASTIISRASGEERVNERKPISRTDPLTGKKIHIETGRTYVDKKTGKTARALERSTKMKETDNAYSLVSGHSKGLPVESLYADYANNMKANGNRARKAALHTKTPKVDPIARAKYDSEVKSLEAKLNIAKKRKPLERKAAMLGNAKARLIIDDNPDLERDKKTKIMARSLQEARDAMGMSRKVFHVTPREWEAINSRAITAQKMKDILTAMDSTQIKEFSMPRERTKLSDAKIKRAKALLANGYSQRQVADALDVSQSAISEGVVNGD